MRIKIDKLVLLSVGPVAFNAFLIFDELHTVTFNFIANECLEMFYLFTVIT